MKKNPRCVDVSVAMQAGLSNETSRNWIDPQSYEQWTAKRKAYVNYSTIHWNCNVSQETLVLIFYKMWLIKKNALCLRPSWPVLHASRLKRPPFVWDHCSWWCVLCYRRYMIFCFAKIQNRYTMDVIIKPVWCHNQPCANTTYPWITRCGDRAPNRQQSVLSDGFQFLASGVRVTNSLPSAVGLAWFQCAIRSSHGEIQCIMPTFGGWLKTTNGIDVYPSSLWSGKAATSNQRDLSCCCSHFDWVMWPLVLRIHYDVMNIHQFEKMRKYKKLQPYFRMCSDKWKHSTLTTHCLILVSIRCVSAEPIDKVDIPTTNRPSG